MKNGRIRGRYSWIKVHWTILELIAKTEGQTLSSLASDTGMSTKTVFRHIKTMEDVGFHFTRKLVEQDNPQDSRRTRYGLPIRMKRLVLELLTNRDLDCEQDWKDGAGEICGHDTLHGEYVPGCNGCKQTLADFREEQKEAERNQLIHI